MRSSCELGADRRGHLLADARASRAICLGAAREQRVDVAEALREVAPGHLPHLLDPEREQHARERPLLGGLDRGEQVARRDLAEALELDQLLLA